MKKLVLILTLTMLSFGFSACGSNTTTRLGHEVPKAAAPLVLPPTGDGLRDEFNYYRNTPITDSDYAKESSDIDRLCQGKVDTANLVFADLHKTEKVNSDRYSRIFADYQIGVDYQCAQYSYMVKQLSDKWFLKDLNY